MEADQRTPRFFSAPMADLTHAGFRAWCETWGGCDLYVTEMISARGLVSGGPWEDWYVETRPVPEKTVFQLWGVRAEDFVAAVERLRRLPVRGIDVNMGCCAPMIRSRGGGIAWMADIGRAAALVAALRRLLPDKTLSAKIRLGETEDPERLVRFARALEDEGLDWIALNPQTRKESRSRPGRWPFVTLLKESLRIPVVGNGGIVDWESFRRRRDASGADGYMIGRGAVAKPWIFAYLAGREADPAFRLVVDRREAVLLGLDMVTRWQPPEFVLSRSKRLVAYWAPGLRFGSRLADRASHAGDAGEIRDLVAGYFERNPEEILLTEGDSAGAEALLQDGPDGLQQRIGGA